MGSKRKLAPEIVNFIVKREGKITNFYDLFAGGGAISFFALQHPSINKVFYNELNSAVVAVLEDIMKNGITEKYYQWITRDVFKEAIEKDDWFSGLCQLIWSFGNNQKDYLYGKKIESEKKILHDIVVNKSVTAQKEFHEKFGFKLKLRRQQLSFFEKEDTIQETRLFVLEQIKSGVKLQHLHRLEHLHRLQHLQHLQHMEQLQISNKSYENVSILDSKKTVIYLDPPYEKTNTYKEDINHAELLEYIKKSPYKIYVSSYEFDGLECVLEIKNHRSTLSASNNSKKVVEKLFSN